EAPLRVGSLKGAPESADPLGIAMRSLLVPVTLLSLVLVSIVADGGPRVDSVEAGTAVRMSLEELAAEAELILEGRVLTKLVERRDGRIVTDVLLACDRTHAGEPRSFRWLTLPGGVLASGEGLLLAGVPSLDVGGEVVVFLSAANDAGMRLPVGLAQGQWSVARTADGRRFVRQSPMARDVVVSGAVEQRALAYPDFLARIAAGRRRSPR
ncbi:MAG: hypothetical protein WD226_08700, partial [Planctomycetota bacterium]